jgi:hypothetical protein
VWSVGGVGGDNEQGDEESARERVSKGKRKDERAHELSHEWRRRQLDSISKGYRASLYTE